jgi:hypothetical protein
VKSIIDFIRIIEAEQPTFTVGSVVKRLAELHQQYPLVFAKFSTARHDRITKAKNKGKDKDKKNQQ